MEEGEEVSSSSSSIEKTKNFSLLFQNLLLLTPIHRPLTFPVHALTMIGGVDAEAMAATDLLAARERWLWERREEAIGNADLPLMVLLLTTATAEELLVLAVAGDEWLQKPRGRRIAGGGGGVECRREHGTHGEPRR